MRIALYEIRLEGRKLTLQFVKQELKIRVMYDSVVLLLFPLILSTARSNSVCPATREFKLTFSSVDVPSVSFLWSRSGGGSREACAGDCVRDSKCVSFFYNTNTDICTSHDVHFSSTDLDDGDSMYFTMTIGKLFPSAVLIHQLILQWSQ